MPISTVGDIKRKISTFKNYVTFLQGLIRYQFVLGAIPSHVSIPSFSKYHDGQSRIYETGKCIRKKYSLLNNVSSWRSCSVLTCGVVIRIRVWPLRRDDRSGILIGACGTRRSDWPRARIGPKKFKNRVNTME